MENEEEDQEEDDDEEEEEEDDDERYHDEDEEEGGDEGYLPARNVEEDEEFDKAFRDMMIESIDAVKTHHKTGDLDRMAIPTVIPKAKNTFAPLLDEDDDYEDDDDEEESRRKTVSFKLLSRDTKGRVEARQLLVPEESPMALKLLASEEQEREERERLRARVLQYDALSEEEEYQRKREFEGSVFSQTSGGFVSRGGGMYGGSSRGARASSTSGGGSDSLNLKEFLAVADSGSISGAFIPRQAVMHF